MRRTLALLGAAAVLACLTATARPAQPPDPKPERWVHVTTEGDRELREVRNFRIRVDGGAREQVKAAPPRREFGKWESHPPTPTYSLRLGAKQRLYRDDDPVSWKKYQASKKYDDLLERIVLTDASGENPKQLIRGLRPHGGFYPCPDGKSVYCGAEEDGKWHVFRVPIDGTPPVKVSRTPGIASPGFRVLSDGRVVYRPVTGFHTEKVATGTWTEGKGPVLLTDGTTETALIKEETTLWPEVTDDVSKMALVGRNAKGEPVVEVKDLRTGKSEDFPLAAFHKDWKCRFGYARFSPDGRALLVTFSIGNVVFREKGPLPGDEAEEHFGVIWLDGRKDRTALFRVDQPRRENGYYAGIRHIEWAPAPDAKK